MHAEERRSKAPHGERHWELPRALVSPRTTRHGASRRGESTTTYWRSWRRIRYVTGSPSAGYEPIEVRGSGRMLRVRPMEQRDHVRFLPRMMDQSHRAYLH